MWVSTNKKGSDVKHKRKAGFCTKNETLKKYSRIYYFKRDSLLFLDLLVRTRIPYVKFGYWVSDPKEMLKNYVKTWFFPDLLSTIPFDLFFWSSLEGRKKNLNKPFLAHYGARLTRFIRLPHVYNYFSRFELRSVQAHWVQFYVKISLTFSCNLVYYCKIIFGCFNYMSLGWLCIFCVCILAR